MEFLDNSDSNSYWKQNVQKVAWYRDKSEKEVCSGSVKHHKSVDLIQKRLCLIIDSKKLKKGADAQ